MSAVGVQELPARDTSDQSARRKARRLPRINFRPLLFAAVGCVTGVYLYLRIAFGGFVPSDALFVAVFCALLVLRPKRGAIAAAILFIAFAGLGAGLFSFACSNFTSGERCSLRRCRTGGRRRRSSRSRWTERPWRAK